MVQHRKNRDITAYEAPKDACVQKTSFESRRIYQARDDSTTHAAEVDSSPGENASVVVAYCDPTYPHKLLALNVSKAT